MKNTTISIKPDVDSLRQQHYNATIADVRTIHDDLAVYRIVPDNGPMSFQPGQYATLGLGMWEVRVPGCQNESLSASKRTNLVRRAYSISSPICDEYGSLSTDSDMALEFYIALVRSADHRPPALTPRLFNLRAGDRIFMAETCHGSYTLNDVKPTDTVVFIATGTGEAPHNSMITELIRRNHRAPIVSLVCTRYKRDLGYLVQHRRLERTHYNYSYWPLTSREPENLDAELPNYVGKRYVQTYFSSGQFEHDLGMQFRRAGTHFYLCGNPEMIGTPSHGSAPKGMVALLQARGFQVDKPGLAGNVHIEKYW